MIKNKLILLFFLSYNLTVAQIETVIAPPSFSRNISSGKVDPSANFFMTANENTIYILSTPDFNLYNMIFVGCRIHDYRFTPNGKYIMVRTFYDGSFSECLRIKLYDIKSGDLIFETIDAAFFNLENDEEITTISKKGITTTYHIAENNVKKISNKALQNEFSQIMNESDFIELAFENNFIYYGFYNKNSIILLNNGYQIFLTPHAKTILNNHSANLDKIEFTNIRSLDYRTLVFTDGNRYFKFQTGNSIIDTNKTTYIIENNTLDTTLLFSYKTSWAYPDLFEINPHYNALSGNFTTSRTNQEISTIGDIEVTTFFYRINGKKYPYDYNIVSKSNDRQNDDFVHVENIEMYFQNKNIFKLNECLWNTNSIEQFELDLQDKNWKELADSLKLKIELVDADTSLYSLYPVNIPPIYYKQIPYQDKLRNEDYFANQNFEYYYKDKHYYFQAGIIRKDFSDPNSNRFYFENQLSIGLASHSKLPLDIPNKITSITFLSDSTYDHAKSIIQDIGNPIFVKLHESQLAFLDSRNKSYINTIQKKYNNQSIEECNKSLFRFYFDYLPENTVQYKFIPNKAYTNKVSEYASLFCPSFFTKSDSPSKSHELLRNSISIVALHHPAAIPYGININLRYHPDAPSNHNNEFGGIAEIYNQEITLPTLSENYISINWGQGYFKLKDKNLKTIVTGFVNEKYEFILVTPDGYYFGSKKLNNRITFRHRKEAYPYQQFDLKYNRPDIVLQRMGCNDSIIISALKNVYIKRLKKSGFTEEMLKEGTLLPTIKFKNIENTPTVTDTSEINLEFDLSDPEYNLDRINIFINEVPIYGTSGIDLRKENTQAISRKINLTLSEGENKIQVSVLNQAGAESYKETVYITYKPKKSAQSDLFLITVGDSKYNDNRYDLTYASKDATDIASAFQNNLSYSKVNIFTYTDEKVTRKNILALKEELKKAKRDDVVIITVAGHGVLDDKLDFYLATHDMDFSNPSERGIPYEELESLLDGIAPLKKVLFLDACHSGEVDKEEVEQIAMNTSTTGSVKFRAAGAGIQKKNIGLKTTSELMNELFTDLRRGTGATVVSSAGGAEFAMESDQWKNGLFTYCLLHGLKDKAADANNDGQIMLSELQAYLRKEVTELSNGAQQPTSRIENLSMDFRIW